MGNASSQRAAGRKYQSRSAAFESRERASLDQENKDAPAEAAKNDRRVKSNMSPHIPTAAHHTRLGGAVRT